MNKNIKLKQFFLVGFSFFTILFFLNSCKKTETNKQIIAYFPQWRMEQNPYPIKKLVSNNAADKITILNYAFAIPTPDSNGNIYPELMNSYYDYEQIYSSDMSIDGISDDSTQALKGHFNQIRKLKNLYPNIKAVISIGGWTGSKYFSVAAQTKESRQQFVKKTIETFIIGNLPNKRSSGGNSSASGVFDGIDIDWEYPVAGGSGDIIHNDSDNVNLTKMLKLFREELDKIDSSLLLTIAVPAQKYALDNYDLANNHRYLNYINLMTYDFSGSWDSLTNHHTNIIRNDSSHSLYSMDKTVKILIDDYKVPNNKIIPGVAFYGHGLGNVLSNEGNVLFQEGEKTTELTESSSGYYRDLKNLPSKGFDKYWDNEYMAPYLYNPTSGVFWSYDDEQSIVLKSQYVDSYNLGGVMLWEITGDDDNGTLITAISKRKMSARLPAKNNKFPEEGLKIEYPDSTSILKTGTNLPIVCNQTTDKISQVEFLVDGKSIGIDTEKPFSWIWFNIPKGQHEIQIKTYLANKKVFHSTPQLVNVL